MKKVLTYILVIFCVSFFSLPVFATDYNLSATAGQIGYSQGKTIYSSVQLIVTVILSALAIVFFALMLYSGIVWMTAQSKEEKITKARETIVAAIIGLIIVGASYGISSFVFNALDTGAKAVEGLPVECSVDQDCSGGRACAGGFCELEGPMPGQCDRSEDCQAGEVCTGHVCVGGTVACDSILDKNVCQAPNCRWREEESNLGSCYKKSPDFLVNCASLSASDCIADTGNCYWGWCEAIRP